MQQIATPGQGNRFKLFFTTENTEGTELRFILAKSYQTAAQNRRTLLLSVDNIRVLFKIMYKKWGRRSDVNAFLCALCVLGG